MRHMHEEVHRGVHGHAVGCCIIYAFYRLRDSCPFESLARIVVSLIVVSL